MKLTPPASNVSKPGGLLGWVGERLPVSGDQLRELTNEPVPRHLKHWWWCLGGTPAYLFVVQILTGILLAFYYESSPARAHESIRYITNEAALGWYIRSVHAWGATLMIASMILHQMRVYFTGAYRKPREINWMIGVFILLCTLMTGFTGYSLVYEQLSYWGATVGANIADNVPFIGGFFKQMLLGGSVYNEHTLPRFYIFHAAVLPGTLVALLIVHITLLRLQGVTEFRFEDEPPDKPKYFSFFPDHFATELIIGLTLMILLSTLAILFPAIVGPKADPLTTPEVIKPEWYFYVSFRWLKLFTGSVAVLSMGFVVFIMLVWPFVDAWFEKRWPKKELSVWIGIGGVFLLVGLTVWEALVKH